MRASRAKPKRAATRASGGTRSDAHPVSAPSGRRGARRVAWALAAVVACLALWPAIGGAFSAAFRGIAGIVLEPWTFGRGGHIELSAAHPDPATVSELDANAWDTSVALSIEGVPEAHRVRISPRRLAFLPLLVSTAIVVASPLTRRRKMTCLIASAVGIAAFAIASVWVTSAWLFARVPGLVYDLDSSERAALAFAYEAFVTSLGNKFVVPLCISGCLVAWHLSSERRAKITVP